jgi:hypothetical protein
MVQGRFLRIEMKLSVMSCSLLLVDEIAAIVLVGLDFGEECLHHGFQLDQ